MGRAASTNPRVHVPFSCSQRPLRSSTGPAAGKGPSIRLFLAWCVLLHWAQGARHASPAGPEGRGPGAPGRSRAASSGSTAQHLFRGYTCLLARLGSGAFMLDPHFPCLKLEDIIIQRKRRRMLGAHSVSLPHAVRTVISVLQITTPRLREMKSVAPKHTASSNFHPYPLGDTPSKRWPEGGVFSPYKLMEQSVWSFGGRGPRAAQASAAITPAKGSRASSGMRLLQGGRRPGRPAPHWPFFSASQGIKIAEREALLASWGCPPTATALQLPSPGSLSSAPWGSMPRGGTCSTPALLS